MKNLYTFLLFILTSLNSFSQAETTRIVVFEAKTFQTYYWDGSQYQKRTDKLVAGYNIYFYINELVISSKDPIIIIGTEEPQLKEGINSGLEFGDLIFKGVNNKTGQNAEVTIRGYKNTPNWVIQMKLGTSLVIFEGNIKKDFIEKL